MNYAQLKKTKCSKRGGKYSEVNTYVYIYVYTKYSQISKHVMLICTHAGIIRFYCFHKTPISTHSSISALKTEGD